jgi:YHS domain-containing protein
MKYFAVALVLVISITARAQKTEIFAPSGIDVVEFFKQKAEKGNSAISAEWKGVKWYFSTVANKELFQKNPEKYEPQFGGWCAYGASRGYKAPTEADTWTLVNNKLYFNYNLKVKDLWDKNRPAYIDSANAKWPLFKNN